MSVLLDEPGTVPDMQSNTLLLAVVGSTAYGLADERSDVDHIGVFRAPTRDLLGLDGPAFVEHSIVTTDPDVSVHELGKFARLALAGNPTVTEVLWASQYPVRTDDGAELIAARTHFLSRRAVTNAYLGYAIGQARRLHDRDNPHRRGSKHARHCARLLLQAEQLLTTGELTLDVSDHRDALFERGEQAVQDPGRFLDWATRQAATLEQIPSVLPEHPDRDRVDALVRTLRLRDLAVTSP